MRGEGGGRSGGGGEDSYMKEKVLAYSFTELIKNKPQ